MNHTSATIAAIATPRGTGGVAIIRVSGPESWQIVRKIARSDKPWSPGQVVYDWLVDPSDGQRVDEVLILPFQAPKSFTGEDCVEIHCHGGLFLSKAVLMLCLNQGAQPAVEGEFTKRAFLNGRLDLTQAESVLDLIHAQGEALVKLSANNLHQRAVGKLIDFYLAEITRIQADLTASIDFPDEVDEPDRQELAQNLCTLASQLQEQLDRNRRNQVLRDGMEVALIGLPNAGKSSLFNALISAERSIVTEIPGTTRDIIREPLSVNGVPVMLIDTAGLRETSDRVESIGVERSWQAIDSADAVILVVDGRYGLQLQDQQVLDTMQAHSGLVVYNKSDEPDFQSPGLPSAATWPWVKTSAKTGEGLTEVITWLEGVIETHTDRSQLDYLLSQRQVEHVSLVYTELMDAASALSQAAIPLDLATVPLTNALMELQGLLGQDTTELVLDSVFARFCVGK